jgi:uncharacterized membrane protein
MKNVMKEISLLALVAMPYVYLASIWNSLPEIVPTHFNLAGEANDWHHKTFLIYMPGVIFISIYLLFRFLPKLDPKGKIEQMGEKKYFSFRFIILLFFALLNIYILNKTHAGKLESPNMMLALIGGLFAAMGNYFQALRPNYFIGIRTPWTLESESVWRKTHHLGGRLWMGGGIFIVLLSFFITDNLAFGVIFGTVTAILVIVPLVFSYTEFHKEKKMVNTD